MTTVAAESRAIRVDFARDVHAIGGLPIDAVDLAEAVRRVRAAAHAGTRCVLATPNLNFVQLAAREPAFRNSICRSDLVVADGMPLVWMARVLGAPIRERVAGADLFEALRRHPGPPVRVYFFGGPSGAAQAACRALSSGSPGLACVGHETPPFVASIDELDGDATVARINDSGAQFVVVSLGAAKGQAWIDRHAERLRAPVLAHLGAVVNFAAGSVRRAPEAWRRAGLEWLWRIRAEPTLWRRYWNDGRRFAGFVARDLSRGHGAVRARSEHRASQAMEVRRSAVQVELVCAGRWSDGRHQALRTEFARAAKEGASVALDLSAVEGADTAFVGLLLLARTAFGTRLALRRPSDAITRALRACGATWILS